MKTKTEIEKQKLNTAVILMYRRDCDKGDSPFSGIEVVGIEQAKSVDDNFDDIIKPLQAEYPHAVFHIC